MNIKRKEMIKRYKWLVGVMVVTLATFSCKKDLLDIKPIDFVSDAAVFQDITLTNQFVNDIYGSLLSGFERRDFGWEADWSRGFANLDMMTDDIEGHNDLPMNNVQAGDLNPEFSMGTQLWASNYALIRKANTLLARIDDVPTTNTTLRDRLKAETKFLRAFAYADLVKSFGGVPLIITEQRVTDDLEVPRNTYDECVAFIIKECDEAAAGLQPSYPDGADLGRATKGAALALKARVLLYHASPLNNPNNTLGRWDDAAKAAQQVMALAPVTYDIHPDYYQLFMTKAGNKEVIFSKKFGRPSRTHQSAHMLHMSFTPNTWGGWGAFHATQNLVDAFEMRSTGLRPDQTGSGYVEQDPYANRDFRLDKAMLMNGSQFKGITVETFQGASPGIADGNANDRTNGDRTKTGYGLRKFIDDKNLTSDAVYQGGDNDWIYMRYAEVLLNYAEAKNEFSGPDGSV
ncbi:MAG: RagB/SusD family nutrient uptake outer membrane protein, partial [Pedobacter sp.]